MSKLYRKTWLRENFFGIDSIQGYLEMAQWYHKGHVKFVCSKIDESKHGSLLFILNQLEKDKDVVAEWANYKTESGEGMLELKQISLTVQGHKLLEELKLKSKIGSVRKRVIDILWVIVTTICTSLVVLKLKGL